MKTGISPKEVSFENKAIIKKIVVPIKYFTIKERWRGDSIRVRINLIKNSILTNPIVPDKTCDSESFPITAGTQLCENKTKMPPIKAIALSYFNCESILTTTKDKNA